MKGASKMAELDEKKLARLNAFEISARMLGIAEENAKGGVFLNAGRGNPNWINTNARLANNLLVEFGVQEAQRTFSACDLAGYTDEAGIVERFAHFLDEKKDDEAAKFLQQALDYVTGNLHQDRQSVIAEWTNGAIGNNYPVPSRVLQHTEVILNHYLQATLYNDTPLADQTRLFPTEGGTAAIVYIFNSLKENKLIQPGDKIAMNTPIFTPYLQIPELNDYELVEVDLSSKEENNWQIPADEIKKLRNPAIKALFVVNPSNPGAHAFSANVLAEIKKMVALNPELMIITDDVYGPFIQNFKSIYAVAPYNTLLVYSFSKLYGATGWRLGLIALNEENVFNHLMEKLPASAQHELEKRLAKISLDVKHMHFIDRIVADSRSIGLSHTGGLSTPQQIQMTLFALDHLVNLKADEYTNQAKALVAKRYATLMNTLELPTDDQPDNTKYYVMVNIYELAEKNYGAAFRKYLTNDFQEIDFLLNLAKKNGVVLMDGLGFGSQPGYIRISQANLPTEDYALIGQQILSCLHEYYEKFQQTLENNG